MADQDYLLHRPPAPSAWKRGLDLVVLPALIDAAALLESGLERVAVRTRRRPEAALALALGLGVGLGLRLGRRRRR